MRAHSLKQLKKYLKNKYLIFLIKKHRKQVEHKSCNRICILPAARYGSLGDEAMVIALAESLNKSKNVLSIINYDSKDQWGTIHCNLFSEQNTLPSSFFKFNSFLKFLSCHDVLFINGADVLDGKYSVNGSLNRLQYACLAFDLGLKVIFTGFSFNKNPPLSIISFINSMPEGIKFCCRDFHSHSRFVDMTQKKAELVADLAFLLDPDHRSSYVVLIKRWVELQRQEGRLIIGLTPNVLFNNGQSVLDVKKYADILYKINTLYQCSFLLIPHDYRGKPSDLDYVQAIGKLCGDLDILLVDKVCSARELKAIASFIDFSITGRMHFAIACLSSGIPVLGVSYQDKFEGLFEMFDQRNCLVDSQSMGDVTLLVEKTSNIVDSLDQHRNSICAKLSSIKTLANKNLEGL